MPDESNNEFSGWAIVELMGHTRLAGLCSQSSVAGLPAMRLDVFSGDDEAPCLTKYFPNGNAFYAVTPATEDSCRKIGEYQHRQAAQYALPAPAVTAEDPDDSDDKY